MAHISALRRLPQLLSMCGAAQHGRGLAILVNCDDTFFSPLFSLSYMDPYIESLTTPAAGALTLCWLLRLLAQSLGM